MLHRFALLTALFGFGFVFACTGSVPGQGHPQPDAGPDGPNGCGEPCLPGTHPATDSCACIPDTCPDPGICGSGLQWDFVACACEPVAHCDVVDNCPINESWDDKLCQCVPYPDGGPPPGCFIPGYGDCALGTTCVVAYCPDSTPITCYCSPQGHASCGGTCAEPPPDGGPPPPPPTDGGPPPPFDGGPGGCWLPGAGYCPAYTSCVTGYCPDHVTPISCYCEGNGVSQCTGACPPGPPVDAGWGAD